MRLRAIALAAPAVLVLLATTAGCGRLRPRPEADAGAAAPATTTSASTATASASAAPVAPAEPPPGYVAMTVLGVTAAPSGGAAVFLVHEDEGTVVPIFVGGTEALSIELRFEGERYPRPLTHDLLDGLVGRLGGRTERVQVDSLRNNTFIGSVFVRRGAELVEVDARPSDAIALALGARAPIYVALKVLKTAGVPKAEVVQRRADGSEVLEVPGSSRGKRGDPMSL